MSIIRRKKEQYTVVCNDILNNEKLTLEALGMLIFMLSKPNDWEFSQEWLGNRFGKGRDAMRSIMRNLTECGYVRREITRNEKGQIRTITIVSESPELLSYQETSSPPVAKPEVDNPTIGEPTPLVNTDINKLLSNKLLSKEENTLPECINKKIWEEWISYRKSRKLTCTHQTLNAQIQKLTEWASKGHNIESIIKESILNGWQGIFEPKNLNSSKKPKFDNFNEKDYGETGLL